MQSKTCDHGLRSFLNSSQRDSFFFFFTSMYCLNYWNFSYIYFFLGVKHLTVSFPAEIKTTFISLKIEGLYFM